MNYEAIAEYSQIASAVLFFAAMIWIWFRFIQPAVLSAQENANAQIAEAERHRDDAKAVLDSLQGEVAAAQRDAAAIKDRCVAQARTESEAILREARDAGRAVRAKCARRTPARSAGCAREAARRSVESGTDGGTRAGGAAHRSDRPIRSSLPHLYPRSFRRAHSAQATVGEHG